MDMKPARATIRRNGGEAFGITLMGVGDGPCDDGLVL